MRPDCLTYGVAGGLALARRRAARGQTLIEVLVAMVVLGAGIVSVMRAFSVCSGVLGALKSEVVARNHAMRLLAELRANPSLLMSDEEGTLAPEYPGFTWRRQVREAPERGVLAVRITVEWRNRGIARDYCLETLIRTPRV